MAGSWVHFDIVVTGKVQGVWYRASAAEKAEELGLRGYAENRSDGSVHILVEGPPGSVDRFITWCRTGPPRAQVHLVRSIKGELAGAPDFQIKR